MSDLEDKFAVQMNIADIPAWETEYRFHPRRRFRFDFAWPALKVAVEVEGGVWSGGRHTRGDGFENDCRKYNLATLAGWQVYRVTGGMIDSGEALAVVEQAVHARSS
jgi:very-short-patch-repair endonuclease